VTDSEFVSHFDWRDESHILAWAYQRGESVFFYLFTDLSREKEIVGRGVLTVDGHCSYSPDRRWILTDTYPMPRTALFLLFRRRTAAHHVGGSTRRPGSPKTSAVTFTPAGTATARRSASTLPMRANARCTSSMSAIW
jgi:hypothetical protein